MVCSTVRRSPLLALLLIACAPVLAACQTDGAGTPMAQAAPPAAPKPLTRPQIAMQCWMALEKGRKDASLDKRADIVTKCIDDKMNAAQMPAAAAPDAASKPPRSKT